VIPDLRLQLPFIDEAGNLPLQDQGGIDGGRLARIRVDVQSDDAPGNLQSGAGLAAGLWPLQHNGPDGFKQGSELRVYDPRVVHRVRKSVSSRAACFFDPVGYTGAMG